MIYVEHYLDGIANHPLIYMAIYAIVLDIVFGSLRCLKERNPNSAIGINGMIRKAAMVLSMALLFPVDLVMHMNLIGFVPKEITDMLHLSSIGLCDFFAIMYLSYEIMSVMKNMTLCGLPIKRIWEATYKFLKTFTDELPDED